MPLLVDGIRTEIFAPNLTAVNQAAQLIARVNTASPCIGVIVDADLVKRRRVDAVKPIGYISDVNGSAVPDDGA
jgi:hypothetical protein